MMSWLKPLAAAAALCVVATDYEEVDFAALSDFDYVEGMELPDHVTKLDGKEIEISGFMRSEDGDEGETEYFMLINDACGCEGLPFLNEAIFCAMPEGELTDIKPGTVVVKGKIYIGEAREDGVVISLYEMEVDEVVD